MQKPLPKLQVKNGRWTCPLRFPGWPGDGEPDVWFETAGADDLQEPDARQLAALQRLADGNERFRTEALAQLAQSYPEMLADAGFEGADLAARIAEGFGPTTRLSQVIVWRPRGGVVRIGFDFEWELEEEHGLGLCWSPEGWECGPAERVHP